ncbi:GNAT family N-acetyltransferase [Allorhizobium sp. BGMRC 0089]|uniref:GNAT family N-acetyltransferase n=1 Tax=Allorhizobium sonneratiae TaxID=2934936 RepID=UPI00203460B0|nr:GNAT family N-acetyltransferase [Allorhizobium sonneratiae]MCM2293436.1 GNAT family N-acetyltransferase [Allorhizobium sonneratiae]
MTTLSIEVRPASAADAVALSNAHRQAWQYTYSGLIPHKALTRMLERRDVSWWRKAINGPATVLVADMNGDIAGYATMGLNRARGLPYDGEIYEIYLKPEYQGVGLGHVLFTESRRLLKSLGCRGLVIWCLEECQQAASFFRSKGGTDAVEGMEDFDDVKLKKLGFVWG